MIQYETSAYIQLTLSFSSQQELSNKSMSEEERPIKPVRAARAKCGSSINQFTQNNFINLRFRQTLINILIIILKADEKTASFLKERTNEQVCEFVDKIGKYFWDVLRLNTEDDIRQLQHYYQTQFKL
ncbi:Hypothetical_protein [Hexamita inflata]|uniref:Hypothetical_protein n=1 Tax=Hexamita inflata TaxID=28002 RepID=A0AA86RNL9_9EUKA|nr:Hypothetical protein HINF_LOCUS65501 [Hexamita inflata]